MADKIKILLAVLILAGAVAGFYTYEEQSMLYRVLGMLGAVAVATVIALQTEAGRHALAFSRGAWVEVRKVVWPTRKETLQTTVMVMVMVIIVGIILWIFDLFLGWGIQSITGQGG
jgi:preprotein translocase subunit SecE